ncbi:hypothetical protein [Hartmannibacter diazotrophicus]|uniref:hypothetical protein n=1 Tax=Hartmannibacter diazotrophicus TaxID=1482074 RepID=UPI0012FE6C7B|nr:hypothetical protein [Hartmannibacter diazotrophicus]
MEQYRQCKTLTIIGATLAIAIAASMVDMFSEVRAQAQTECVTVKDCAQQMVILANALKDENAALLKRVVALEADLAKYKTDDAAALEARVVKLRTGSNSNDFPGGNGESGVCPGGKFMVGARWQSDSGGPHGILSWFGPICRDLP